MEKQKKEQIKGYYKDIPWESDDELYVLYWLFELKDKSIIVDIERGKETKLSSELFNHYTETKKLKNSEKFIDKEKKILESHYYTPEFSVSWSMFAPPKLLFNLDKLEDQKMNSLLLGVALDDIYVTLIEVKPDFDKNNMTRLFRLNQKWIWQSRKLYINLLTPKSLFEKTFTPKEYLVTRVKKTEREIKWKVRTIDEYLAS